MNKNGLENIWPEWQIEEPPLGRGSYGVVYKAVKNEFGVRSTSAIKVISVPHDEFVLDSLIADGYSEEGSRTYCRSVVTECVDEIRLMESFKGVANIVSVEDYRVVERTDRFGWDIFIRMELLTPLTKRLSEGELTEAEAAKLGVDICSALELCKSKKIIHRDIKPQNIFINAFGSYKLGDFGIARSIDGLTRGLSMKGTLTYMAPEVERGEDYDESVDIYSLGMVLYYCLNKKRLPFLDTEKQLISSTEREQANHRRLSGEPLPPPCSASPLMADIILCACDPDPKQRFSTASAMKTALQAVIAQQEAPACPAKPAAKVPVGVNASAAPKPTPAPAANRVSPASLQRTVNLSTATQQTAQTFVPQQTPVYTAAPRPVQNRQKERSKLPFIIGLLLALCLLIGAALIIIPKLIGGSGDTSANSDNPGISSVSTSPGETAAPGEAQNTPIPTAAVKLSDTNALYNLSPGSYKTGDDEHASFEMGSSTVDDGFAIFCKDAGHWSTYGYFSIDLDQKYSSVTFDIGHVNGTSMGDIFLTVHLDDTQLGYDQIEGLAEDGKISMHTASQTITIPVQGVKTLFIELSTPEYYAYNNKNAMDPYYGFANFCMKPDPDYDPSSMQPAAGSVKLSDTNSLYNLSPGSYKTGDDEHASFEMGSSTVDDGFAIFCKDAGHWSTYGYFSIDLDRKYSSVTFDIGHVNGTNMGDIFLTVHLDDTQLGYDQIEGLAEDGKISMHTASQTITIPVQGVKTLFIELSTPEYYAYNNKNAMDPYYGFANFYLTPKA